MQESHIICMMSWNNTITHWNIQIIHQHVKMISVSSVQLLCGTNAPPELHSSPPAVRTAGLRASPPILRAFSHRTLHKATCLAISTNSQPHTHTHPQTLARQNPCLHPGPTWYTVFTGNSFHSAYKHSTRVLSQKHSFIFTHFSFQTKKSLRHDHNAPETQHYHCTIE